jgi:bifunctional non-homologous end joining protein LigD
MNPREADVMETAPVMVLGVELTHPDKALWSGDEITKLDLARYFEAMGERILPHIRGRPCGVMRTPGGPDGGRFMQRHLAPRPHPLFAASPSPEGGRPYLQIDTPEALIAAAQIDAVELHPWNCATFDPDRPGRLVFDLDPAPDVPFDEVIAAAHEVRERLDAAGLTGFCKTTGGKGLHVVTPTRGVEAGWTEALAFSRKICRMMEEDAPDRYVTRSAKSERVGRIYLDYLRNARAASAVAPYSPRAAAGAPVSMPLAWEVVKPGLDPARYTLRTAPELAGKDDAWEGYDKSERSLRAAAKALDRR